MKILIVDDDIYTVLALTNLLQHEHELRVAANGEDAFRLFKKSHFDVVVTDIRMPKMNGIELLKAIRQNDTDTAVIIISGHGTSDCVAEAAQYGARAIFDKPLDVGGFMDILFDLGVQLS